MEVLTSLVTVSQIVGYTIELISEIHRIYHSSHIRFKVLKHRLSQIQRLGQSLERIRATHTFSDSTSQASSHLTDHLKAIAEIITLIRGSIETEIRKHKRGIVAQVCGAIFNKVHQEHLELLFAQLEAEKSALGISSLGINMHLMRRMHRLLKSMKKGRDCQSLNGTLAFNPTNVRQGNHFLGQRFGKRMLSIDLEIRLT